MSRGPVQGRRAVSRRKDDGAVVEIIAVFAELPLWAAPVGAALAYLLLQFALPALMPKSMVGITLSRLSVMSAPWLAGAILVSGVFGAVKRLFGQAGDRRILARQVSIDSIRALSWSDFERMLAAAYRARGYDVSATARGADGGVDHILRRDGQTTYLQAKQWKARKVGVEKVRELHGVAVADGVSASILVTSGFFSDAAKAFAQRTGTSLVDGHGLMPLIRPFFGGELSATGASTGNCPLCGAHTVVRQARRGQRAGSRFLGCSRYPACRGTRDFAA